MLTHLVGTLGEGETITTPPRTSNALWRQWSTTGVRVRGGTRRSSVGHRSRSVSDSPEGAVMSVTSQLDIGGAAPRTADLVHSGLESLWPASPRPFADSSWEAHHNEEKAEEHSN
jgi:hypothetical protein